MRWTGVRREGVVRPLSHHAISVSITGIRGLAHWWSCLIAVVVHVLWCNLRAALLLRRYESVIISTRGWRWHGWQAVARHEGLSPRIEGTVETARNRMLAFWVIGVNIDWKSTKSIRYAARSRWCGPGLVRT